jgi:hypothetical protein
VIRSEETGELRASLHVQEYCKRKGEAGQQDFRTWVLSVRPDTLSCEPRFPKGPPACLATWTLAVPPHRRIHPRMATRNPGRGT